MNQCSRYHGIAYTIESNKMRYVELRCKQWQCEYCAEKNRSMWRASIIDNINKLSEIKRKWSFMTLTAHEKMRGLQSSYKSLSQGWKKLYDRIRRKYGKQEYIRVYESHKDGSLHLHFIISEHLPKKWLKTNARSCGMGYMTDVQHIEGHAGLVAAYITKYMTKALTDYPKGFRRIQGSRGFTLRKNAENDSQWILVNKYTDERMMDDVMRYDEVYNITTEKLITIDDIIFP